MWASRPISIHTRSQMKGRLSSSLLLISPLSPPHPLHPNPSTGELTYVLHWGPEAPKEGVPSNITHTPSLFVDIFMLKVLLQVRIPGLTPPKLLLWNEGPSLSFHRPLPPPEHHHLLITVTPVGIGKGGGLARWEPLMVEEEEASRTFFFPQYCFF